MLVTGPPAAKLNMALRSPRVFPGTLDTTPPASNSFLLSRQLRRPSGSRWMCTGPTISMPRRIPRRRPPIA